MVYTAPAVVIDNGSQTTRAGFALEDLPLLVFSSVYLVDEAGKVVVGDDQIDKHPENEIMTLLDNGVVYNWENIEANWKYAYDNLDCGIPLDPKEHPLVMTEPSWNSKKNKLAAAQIAFESLEVPIFSLVKNPLAQLYHQGRATGLVIDLGASVTLVTPILDGIIQNKASFHLKYGGEFANLHCLEYLKKQVSGVNEIYPKAFGNGFPANSSPSFINFQIANRVLEDFKSSMLQISDVPANASHIQAQHKSYYLPSGKLVPVEQEQFTLLEPVFQPLVYPVGDISIPQPAFEKPSTQGLTHIILSSLKALEASVIPQAILENTTHTSANSSHHARFNEILHELLNNILITGGGSLTTGLSQRLLHDLYKSINQYFPNYLCTQPGRLVLGTLGGNAAPGYDVWDKKFGSWIGACNLGSMLNDDDESGTNIALENWFVTKSDYDELGEDVIFEKFK